MTFKISTNGALIYVITLNFHDTSILQFFDGSILVTTYFRDFVNWFEKAKSHYFCNFIHKPKSK